MENELFIKTWVAHQDRCLIKKTFSANAHAKSIPHLFSPPEGDTCKVTPSESCSCTVLNPAWRWSLWFDLLLTNSKWQRWWESHSPDYIMLYKIPSWQMRESATVLEEVNCFVVGEVVEGPHVKKLNTPRGAENSAWWPASKKTETSVLEPEQLSPITIWVSESRLQSTDRSMAGTLPSLQACETLMGGPTNPRQNFWHTKTETIKVCCFKLLHLWWLVM